jgi:pimeloyl-ACP methyl ester carboxylesterase
MAPAVENQPVTSDIPTLVLAGEYDPITPPEYGRTAAQALASSFFYELPGLGHGVSADNGCAMGLMLDFLAEPAAEPDAACVAEMGGPRFVVRRGG